MSGRRSARTQRARIAGREASFTDHAPDRSSPPVVLVMGTGSPGRVWDAHQVPALLAAGHRPVTVETRGVAPDGSDTGETGFTVDDLAGDVAGLVAHLDAGAAHLVGTSLGSRIVLETALAHPDAVRSVVAMAGAARPDPVQDALTAGEIALHDAGLTLPEHYHAAVTAMHNLSPTTMADPARVRDWLELAALTGAGFGAGVRAQHRLQLEGFADRRPAYAALRLPTLVIGFADDLMMPPRLTHEIHEAIPGSGWVEFSGCGHFGYLERPDAVNDAVRVFLAEQTVGSSGAAVPR